MPALRIASLLAAGTEIVYRLGLGAQVVAVSHECDWPADACAKPRVTRTTVDAELPSAAIDLQVRSRLAAGEPLYELDVERLAALAPDLIVTQAQCDVCAVRYADVIAAVEAHAGLRQARVVDLNPTTLGEVFRDIERVADAAGVPDTGRAVVSELAQRVEAVCRSAASRPRLRVACIEWISPLMLAGNWIPELIEIAGGTQPFTTAGAASTTCEWAALAQFDPEVIVLMPCGFPLERTLREAPALFELAGWNDLAAVRAGAVLAADGNAYFNRSGPRLVDSLEILADAISGRGLREGATARIACASARR